MRKFSLLLILTLAFCGANPGEKFNQALKRGDYILALSILHQVKQPQKFNLKKHLLASLGKTLPQMPLEKILKIKSQAKDPEISSLIEGELTRRFTSALEKEKFLQAGKILRVMDKPSQARASLIKALYRKYYPKSKVPVPSHKTSPFLKAFPKENLIIKYSLPKAEAEAWYWVEGAAARLFAKIPTAQERLQISYAMLYAHSLDVEMGWYGANKGMLTQMAGVNYFVFKHGGGTGLFIWDVDSSSASVTYLKGEKFLLLEIPKTTSEKAKKIFLRIFKKIRFDLL